MPALRRYKAVRSLIQTTAVWNFLSGVGSNYTEPTKVPKPPGYHHRMEGWYGIDRTFNPLPYSRRSTLCALSGGFSLYAGGSSSEAGALCYASAGYGNSWDMTMGRTFNDPGAGNVTLNYRYQTECEPNFDYLFVRIDTTGTGIRWNLPEPRMDF